MDTVGIARKSESALDRPLSSSYRLETLIGHFGTSERQKLTHLQITVNWWQSIKLSLIRQHEKDKAQHCCQIATSCASFQLTRQDGLASTAQPENSEVGDRRQATDLTLERLH